MNVVSSKELLLARILSWHQAWKIVLHHVVEQVSLGVHGISFVQSAQIFTAIQFDHT